MYCCAAGSDANNRWYNSINNGGMTGVCAGHSNTLQRTSWYDSTACLNRGWAMLLACSSTSLVSSASGRWQQTASNASAQFCKTSAYTANGTCYRDPTITVNSKIRGAIDRQHHMQVVQKRLDLPSQSRRHNGVQRTEGIFALTLTHVET